MFASTKAEDIVAHEFGHIISSVFGNKGIDIAQQAYYNVYGELLSVEEIVMFLRQNISQYAVKYSKPISNKRFDKKYYQEVISEVVAKHNSGFTEFTNEFLRIIKERMYK